MPFLATKTPRRPSKKRTRTNLDNARPQWLAFPSYIRVMAGRRRVKPPTDGIVFHCAVCYPPFTVVPTHDPTILAVALRELNEHQKACGGEPTPDFGSLV